MLVMNNERAAQGRARWLALAIVGLPSILQGARSVAEIVPPRGSLDGRIRVVTYDGAQVYRLRGYVGYQIDLEFESGETFVGLGAGDIEGLAYSGQENHLFLKPRAAAVATNLTVLTNRRHYQFDYVGVSRHPTSDDPDVIFALRFDYPEVRAEAAAEASAKRIDAELGAASGLRPQNIDYWYCGRPSMRPVAASDDGIHTRLRFAANADLPAIFVRGDDGSESLLNFSMDGGDVILHRVARQFIIRRGALTGCIVNKGFVGGGTRLESGTVAPRVERRVPGEVP
jgi:type IV secretion system protein VirB9